MIQAANEEKARYSKKLMQAEQLIKLIGIDQAYEWARNEGNQGALDKAVRTLKEAAEDCSIAKVLCTAEAMLKKEQQEAELTSTMQKFMDVMPPLIDEVEKVHETLMKRSKVC